jgi:hypothetical protein
MIKNALHILRDAASTGGAVSYLHDPKVVERLRIAGYLGEPRAIGDFKKYPITKAGREAFARNKIRY